MKLKFVTGNINKHKEVQALLAPFELEQIVLDLDEIQEMDEKKIIEHKARQALESIEAPFIVEDTSFYLECFDYKFPGPFIKFFENYYKASGLYQLAKRFGLLKAKGKTFIAYVKDSENIIYFEGSHEGELVEPRGDKDFGYGAAFLPSGQTKTFGEMEREEKHRHSARGHAANKLKEFLLKQHE